MVWNTEILGDGQAPSARRLASGHVGISADAIYSGGATQRVCGGRARFGENLLGD